MLGFAFSGGQLNPLGGGLFLISKATFEIDERLEGIYPRICTITRAEGRSAGRLAGREGRVLAHP